MFLIMMKYVKPIEVVDTYLSQHRAFLEEGYKKDFFVVSGPRNPRIGGILISQLKNRDQLEKILREDPFYINEIATFEIIEFDPVKYHKNFSHFIT